MATTPLVLALLTALAVVVDSTNVAQCGRRKTHRIVGGQSTVVNEFPMMAGLVNARSKRVVCGATIVSRWSAVTAGHCLLKVTPRDVRLMIGEHDYATGHETQFNKVLLVNKFIVHPGYRGGNSNYDDIALVRTAVAIQYNVAIGPACLPWRHDSFAGKLVEAVGWGTTSFGGRVSTVLQKTSLKVVSNDQCNRAWGHNSIRHTQICTFMHRRDSCQYDSGGPLYLQSGGLVYLAGIVSYGYGCAGSHPGVSTRVTSYADWIRRNM